VPDDLYLKFKKCYKRKNINIEPVLKPIFISIIYKNSIIIFLVRSSIDYFKMSFKKVDFEFWS
jgi:hypothetical protein